MPEQVKEVIKAVSKLATGAEGLVVVVTAEGPEWRVVSFSVGKIPAEVVTVVHGELRTRALAVESPFVEL